MGNEVQSRLDRLKRLLGKEFPEAPPKPEAPTPESSTEDEMVGYVADFDPSIQAGIEGFDSDDCDPAAIHRKYVEMQSKKKDERKMTQPGPTPPFRTNALLLPFHADHERIGQLAPAHQAFCPIVAMSKFPYKFVRTDIAESIAKTFFDGAKFWFRTWDVYYVWPPIAINAKPLLLVPVEQVDRLLDEIYFAFEQDPRYFLSLGDDAKEIGLVNHFPKHPDLQPRFLGRSESRDTFAAMERSVPPEFFRPKDDLESEKSPDLDDRNQYERLMELIIEVSRGQSKPHKKVSKKTEQAMKKRAWKHELQSTEQLLGLRPASRKLVEPGPEASWEELQAYHEAKSTHRTLAAIDPEVPAPFESDDLPIFMSIDVECYELDKSKVTEVGLAMLDTAELVGQAPGVNGKNWHTFIKARHFRVREHAHLFNSHYVPDAAANFEFPQGGSEFIPMENIPETILACFQPPFCNIDRSLAIESPSESEGKLSGSTLCNDIESGSSASGHSEQNGAEGESNDLSASTRELGLNDAPSEDGGSDKGGSSEEEEEEEETTTQEHHLDHMACKEDNGRNIVLVGHDISCDIRYLQHVGVDLTKLDTKSTVDTANLYRAHEQEWNPTSLAAILTKYDMVPWHSHNAGNDAVHTLWAMIALVLAHTMERGDEAAKTRYEERQKQREIDDVVRAGVNAREMAEGWESPDEN